MIEPGISAQIIWPLAAEEAISSQFEYIEPSHLFNAILTFSELEAKHFESLIEDSTLSERLGKESESTRDKLKDNFIEVPAGSTRIRRALRKRMGDGGHEQDRGRTLHRSDATREICHAAEEVAQAAGDRRLEATHLLQVLLVTPMAPIANVLAEFGVLPANEDEDTPKLNEYGHDLTALAREGKLSSKGNVESDPVCKVLIDSLSGTNKRNILLVQDGSRSVGEVVVLLAQHFADDHLSKGATGKRLVELSASNVTKGITTAKDVEDRMQELLKEASEAGNVVLWLSAFHRYPAVGGQGVMDLLKAKLSVDGLPLICSMKHKAYKDLFERNPSWRNLFHTIWVHDLVIPTKF